MPVPPAPKSYDKAQLVRSEYLSPGELEELAASEDEGIWRAALEHRMINHRVLWRAIIEGDEHKKLHARQVLLTRWPDSEVPDHRESDVDSFETRVREREEYELEGEQG